MEQQCTRPPKGWFCTREFGHEGPCAARPLSILKRLIEAHKFFVRKSQHYVLGNWNEYIPWWVDSKFNYQKLKYYQEFPKAYIKFMWLTIRNK